MTQRQSVRMALDILEKEMLVLSGAEILNVLGGSGTPLPDGYCTMNDIAFNLKALGHDVTSQNVLGNFVQSQGTSGFTFSSSGSVSMIKTGPNTNHEAFIDSIFETTKLNEITDIKDAVNNGKFVSLSGLNGHAYTSTGFDEQTQEFMVRDTTTGVDTMVPKGQMGANFANAKAIDGIKANVFGSSGSWSNSSQSSVSLPSTGGSTGTH